MEDLQGRTDIVHNDFKELFTDPLHKETPEWIWQRWPWEVLQIRPTIDSKRVREAAFTHRKRASCAEDHLVIEMLRELDDDMWETSQDGSSSDSSTTGRRMRTRSGHDSWLLWSRKRTAS